MAIGGHQVLDKGFEAAEALTEFRFVTLVATEDRRVEQADVAGELVIGVGQETVSAEDVTRGPRITNVRLMGVSVVEAGAAVTKGAEVTTDASGRAITAGVGNRVAGIALDNAAQAGDWIGVFLTPAGRVV